jgi:hypothetical protein
LDAAIGLIELVLLEVKDALVLCVLDEHCFLVDLGVELLVNARLFGRQLRQTLKVILVLLTSLLTLLVHLVLECAVFHILLVDNIPELGV